MRVAEGLRDRAPDLGVLASPSSTLEELYLAARLTRGAGVGQHRSPAAPARLPRPGGRSCLSRPRPGARRGRRTAVAPDRRLESAPRGADPGAPGAQGRQARCRGGVRESGPLPLPVPGQELPALRAGELVADLAGVLAAAAAASGKSVPAHRSPRCSSGVSASEAQQAAAQALLSGERRAVWLGALARGIRRSPTCARWPPPSRISPAPPRRARRRRQRRRRLSGRCGAAPRGGRQGAGARRAERARQMLPSRCRPTCCSAASSPSSTPWTRDSLAHARQGGARRRHHPVRERAGEARRPCAAADRHLRRDLRHLRELRGRVAEPDRRCRAGRASRARAGRCCGCWATCSCRALRLPVIRGGARGAAHACCADVAHGRLPGRPCGRCAHRPRSQRRAAQPCIDLPMYQIDAVVRRAPSLQRTREGRRRPRPTEEQGATCSNTLTTPGPRCRISCARHRVDPGHHRGADHLRRAPDAVGAQGHRLDAAAPRPEPRAPSSACCRLGQPFADVVKLLIKEVIIPAKANKFLFRLAPMITLVPAFAAWAVIPLSPDAGHRPTSTPACCTCWR